MPKAILELEMPESCITNAAHDLYKALNALVIYANNNPWPIPEKLWVEAEKALDKAEGK